MTNNFFLVSRKNLNFSFLINLELLFISSFYSRFDQVTNPKHFFSKKASQGKQATKRLKTIY